MQFVEILSASLGLLGAGLLATRNRYAGWAFLAWLISNIGWIVFGTGNRHWFFTVQQIGFTATSLIGIWQWLLKPWLKSRTHLAEVSPGPKMDTTRAREILKLVHFPGYKFQIIGNFISSTHLQAAFYAPCNISGSNASRQTTRKWQLSAHMTPSELVQTALKCVLTSIEHEAREKFRYRGMAIFGPHFDVERLVELCGKGDAAQEVRS